MTDFYEEACYLSNGEADDSEPDETLPAHSAQLAWDDPQALLSAWLGELDSLGAVSNSFQCQTLEFPLRPNWQRCPTPRRRKGRCVTRRRRRAPALTEEEHLLRAGPDGQ